MVQQDEALQDFNAATTGAGKGKKGGNGYGECWHCGEWGHPRRECSHFNGPSKGKGSLGALKGDKRGGKGRRQTGQRWKRERHRKVGGKATIISIDRQEKGLERD